MRRASLVLAGWCLAALAVPALAQQPESRPFVLPGVEAFTMQSAIMGERYELVVSLPAGYAQGPTRPWPLLLVTDGYRAFLSAQDAAVALSSEKAIDGLILVSVGVPAESSDTLWTSRRIYEFSPPDWPMTDAFGTIVRQTCAEVQSPTGRCTGGAPDFLRFLVSEVLPLLTGRYRVDATKLGLFGVSAGGFFASWAIFQANSPFTHYIISSPAMAYGDGEIFRQERRYAETHTDLPVRIYMGSGSLEMEHPFLEGVGQIVSGQVRLAAALRSRTYPGLRLFTEIHAGLSHEDNSNATLARGIRLLYGTP